MSQVNYDGNVQRFLFSNKIPYAFSVREEGSWTLDGLKKNGCITFWMDIFKTSTRYLNNIYVKENTTSSEKIEGIRIKWPINTPIHKACRSLDLHQNNH